ncbi:MAG: SEC-C metal-binding domain-containing protein [Chloroflexota bacterium]|nr:SEC-C domain-containing protein [Chloroflexota bacterium]
MSLISGDTNEKEIKRLDVIAKRIIDEFGSKFSNLSDAELKDLTGQFKERLQDGTDLDDILPEAFAAVREAAWRTRKQKHYKVQLVGAMVLHQGKIAEMRTGEGKTLVATCAAYLNALEGQGVHVVTVNDYLAKRDTQTMVGPIYHFLGLTVAVIQSNGGDSNRPSAFILDPEYKDPKNSLMNGLRPISRREAYDADITYGTNNEFGFDYLRDNMARDIDNCVQRELHYAIVDEVDNILIDEARTPLIISGPAAHAQDDYVKFAAVVRQLRRSRPKPEEEKEGDGDYDVNEKNRAVTLTQRGISRVERLVSIPETESIYDDKWSHYIAYLDNALRAQSLYLKDKDYIVGPDGEVVIVDEFTGRMMEGRRYEGGLHQAIEAKEGVSIQRENLTYATITLQNYFRMYDKLAGMTGTAVTEAEEFHKIYKLDVVVIPTNRPMVREDSTDFVYKNEEGKYRAVVMEIASMYLKGRPVLVGTTSVENSELLSTLLDHSPKMINYVSARIEALAEEASKNLEKAQGSATQALRQMLQKPPALSSETITSAVEAAAQELGSKSDRNTLDLIWDIAETVETLALLKQGLPHNILNAKLHEKEASIVAQAGRPGAITIATNMAGRGTDIILGGSPESYLNDELEIRGLLESDQGTEAYQAAQAAADQAWQVAHDRVVELGGLHIIGTERHESARIDNQLRGRAGRQGDPGSSRFYVSLQDELMRRFGADRISGLLERFGFEEDMPIENNLITRSIDQAQSKAVGQSFDIRKHLVEYDDVMNKQREYLYKDRRRILEGENLMEQVLELTRSRLHDLVDEYTVGSPEEWDLVKLLRNVGLILMTRALHTTEVFKNQTTSPKDEEEMEELVLQALEEIMEITTDDLHNHSRQELYEIFDEVAARLYAEKATRLGEEHMRSLERLVMLEVYDQNWVNYLTPMEELRRGIGLRAYGQQDPLQAYKKSAFQMWNDLQADIKREIVQKFWPGELVQAAPLAAPPPTDLQESGPALDNANGAVSEERPKPKPKPAHSNKVGPNEPCPCGSGKKYKKCHGRL